MYASCIILVVFLCANAYKCELSDKYVQKSDVGNPSKFYIDFNKDVIDVHCDALYRNIDNRIQNELQDGEGSSLDTHSYEEDVIVTISDEDYYAMPQMFHLDPYLACVKREGVYCLGNFELSPVGNSSLFRVMKDVSKNWAHFMNHTRIHRGLCLTYSCQSFQTSSREDWFESCVNASMMSAYNFTAKLYSLDYCTEGASPSPLTTNEKAFAVFMSIILALTAISTCLDVKLSDASKTSYRWALSWSLHASWKDLVAPRSSDEDLSVFDGLRVWCMVFTVGSHMGFLNILAYIEDTSFERYQRTLTNTLASSTVIVQAFFMMSTFLMAHKLLRDKPQEAAVFIFLKTMLNRLIRVSPGYFLVIWFSMTWWERVEEGPLWTFLVGREAASCRQNWLSHFMYLDNSIDLNNKCTLQGWYLTVDMQFYSMCLILTLILRKSRFAIRILSVLLVGVVVVNLVVAYTWRIVPNFLMHNYQAMLELNKNNTSIKIMYQSLLGNAASPLVGLLLAHVHVTRTSGGFVDRLLKNKVFRACTVVSFPAAFFFVWCLPWCVDARPPRRLPAAALAALERPVFVTLLAVAMFGAINGVDSPWRRLCTNARVASRLTYGAYLLHIYFGYAVVVSKLTTSHLAFKIIFTETFGVLVWAYAASLVLMLLVEIPSQTLYKEIKNILNTRRDTNISKRK